MKNIKTLLITLGLLLLAFVGSWFYLFDVIQESNTGPAITNQQNNSLILNYGDEVKTTYDSQVPQGSVFDLLNLVALENDIELITESYEFGVYVKSLGGYESGSEKAWIYFVNGQSGTVAADQYQLEAGDVVEWRYIKPE